MTQPNMTAVEAMRSRHSVRKYERGHVIPESELNEILELAGSAPSSWNLQHWRFLVVTKQENKDALLPIAYNQQQVSDCSAVVVVLGDLEADKAAEDVYGTMLQAGAIPQQVYDTMTTNIQNAYANGGEKLANDEAQRNASLAAMQLMLAARAYGYDTVPMGGFDREKLVQHLNIPARFTPNMLIALGKAASPAHASSRFALDKIVIRESF